LGAVEASGEFVTGQELGLEHRKYDSIERLLRVPSVLSERKTDLRERRRLLRCRPGASFQNSGGSRSTFFVRRIAILLAEQGIALFRSTFGKMGHKFLDLLARGLAQSFGAAEFDRIRLHQFSIELVLANNSAEPVANSRAVSV